MFEKTLDEWNVEDKKPHKNSHDFFGVFFFECMIWVSGLFAMDQSYVNKYYKDLGAHMCGCPILKTLYAHTHTLVTIMIIIFLLFIHSLYSLIWSGRKHLQMSYLYARINIYYVLWMCAGSANKWISRRWNFFSNFFFFGWVNQSVWV